MWRCPDCGQIHEGSGTVGAVPNIAAATQAGRPTAQRGPSENYLLGLIPAWARWDGRVEKANHRTWADIYSDAMLLRMAERGFRLGGGHPTDLIQPDRQRFAGAGVQTTLTPKAYLEQRLRSKYPFGPAQAWFAWQKAMGGYVANFFEMLQSSPHWDQILQALQANVPLPMPYADFLVEDLMSMLAGDTFPYERGGVGAVPSLSAATGPAQLQYRPAFQATPGPTMAQRPTPQLQYNPFSTYVPGQGTWDELLPLPAGFTGGTGQVTASTYWALLIMNEILNKDPSIWGLSPQANSTPDHWGINVASVDAWLRKTYSSAKSMNERYVYCIIARWNSGHGYVYRGVSATQGYNPYPNWPKQWTTNVTDGLANVLAHQLLGRPWFFAMGGDWALGTKDRLEKETMCKQDVQPWRFAAKRTKVSGTHSDDEL